MLEYWPSGALLKPAFTGLAFSLTQLTGLALKALFIFRAREIDA